MLQPYRYLIALWLCALLASTAAAQSNDSEPATQLKAFTASVDRLTSPSQEILNRLQVLENKTNGLNAMRASVDQLGSTQMAILQQLQQFRNQVAAVQKAQAPPPAPKPAGPQLPIQMDIGPGRMQGDLNTTVVMIMYGDYQCSFCGRFMQDTFPTLKAEYVDTNRIRFAYRDFPLNSHHDAPRGVVAARCAEDQGKYWEMHQSIEGHQNDLSTRSLESQAKNIGLDVQQFSACLASDKHANGPKLEQAKSAPLAVSLTPTFAFGISEPGSSKITVTKIITGNKPADVYRAALNEVLSAKGAPPKPAS